VLLTVWKATFAVQHGLSSGKGAESRSSRFRARKTVCKCSKNVALHNQGESAVRPGRKRAAQ
jgi:hypothetical protein